MENKTRESGHRLVIDEREYIEITGVLHVDSFDEEEITLETELGLLALRGEGLDIKELNLEAQRLTVEGLVLEVVYSDDGPGIKDKSKGLFSKLFR